MKRLERLVATFFGFGFMFLAFAVAAETMMRKIFNRSLQGVDELGGYVLAIGGALCLVIALIERTHIRIDIVHDWLPKPLRIVLNLVAIISIVICAIAMLVMAGFALGDSVLFNSTMQTPWATPLKYPQSAWVAALGLFLIVCMIEAVRIVKTAASGRWDEIDQRYGPRGNKEELKEKLQDVNARGVVTETSPMPESR